MNRSLCPTIILITDRTDLDDQLAEKFTNAKSILEMIMLSVWRAEMI